MIEGEKEKREKSKYDEKRNIPTVCLGFANKPYESLYWEDNKVKGENLLTLKFTGLTKGNRYNLGHDDGEKVTRLCGEAMYGE